MGLKTLFVAWRYICFLDHHALSKDLVQIPFIEDNLARYANHSQCFLPQSFAEDL